MAKFLVLSVKVDEISGALGQVGEICGTFGNLQVMPREKLRPDKSPKVWEVLSFAGRQDFPFCAFRFLCVVISYLSCIQLVFVLYSINICLVSDSYFSLIFFYCICLAAVEIH